MGKSLTLLFRECEKRIGDFLRKKRMDIAPDIPVDAAKLYRITGSKRLGYDVEEWDITNIEVSPKLNGRLLHIPCINKRASRKDLDDILEFENKIKGKDATFSVVILIERREDGSGTWYSSVDYERDIIIHHDCAFSPEALQPEIQRRTEEWEKYYKPRDGYTACAYCGKQTPNDKIVWATIYGRWFGTLTEQKLPFCSKDCASNEQCAREG